MLLSASINTQVRILFKVLNNEDSTTYILHNFMCIKEYEIEILNHNIHAQ